MPVQYSVIIKMGCGKKIAAAVHIDIIVFYFSKQYNEDKKGVCDGFPTESPTCPVLKWLCWEITA